MRVGSYSEILTIQALDENERFVKTDTLVRQQFARLVDAGVIIGAFPFGSTQFGDQSAMSDYDLLVAIPEAGATVETHAFAAMHYAARDIYRQTAAPLEISCFTVPQLRYGLHSLPDPMLAWLKEQHGPCIGADIVTNIPPRQPIYTPEVLADTESYIARTRHMLKKAWLQGEYFRPHDLLSVVFGVPHIAGRKAIDALERSGFVRPGRLPDLRKTTIATAVEQTFPYDHELLHAYTAITRDNTIYQQELLPRIHEITADEYDQIMYATLEDNLPKAIIFLRRLQTNYRLLYNDQAPHHLRVDTTMYTEQPGDRPAFGSLHDALVADMRESQMNSY